PGGGFKIWAGATNASWRRGDRVDQDTVADPHLAVGRGARPGSPLLHRSATEVLRRSFFSGRHEDRQGRVMCLKMTSLGV
uniref:Uncharacterized protein n=1 Tax=Triticum urartu TaxID=4572 RepID=A0A8R7VBW0_TRIUA